MDTVKARVQGNATVVTIPKSFKVKPGTQYTVTKDKDGVLTLTPTKKIPETLDELFKDWHGKYQLPTDLVAWENEKPRGHELW